MMIDLHLHSNHSDGSDTPAQLIDKALKLKLRAIAITDHDTIDGVREFLSYGEDKQIILVPGIEISIRHEPKRELIDVHIVGLNLDYNSPKLLKTLKQQLEGRLKQKENIVKRLKDELNYNITYEEVKQAAGGKTIGRPHIVQVMIQNNPEKVEGKTKNELFLMISIGGVAYVDREFELNLEESIDLINAAGGVPIVAHPGIHLVENRAEFIELFVNAGIKGIEVEYTYTNNRPWVNTDKKEWAQGFLPDFFRKQAENFNLIKSGGSDYHGGKKGIKIGDANVPDHYIKSFI